MINTGSRLISFLKKSISRGAEYAKGKALHSSWTNWIPFFGFRHTNRIFAETLATYRQTASSIINYKKVTNQFIGDVGTGIKNIERAVKQAGKGAAGRRGPKILGVHPVKDWEDKLKQMSEKALNNVRNMYNFNKSASWQSLKTPEKALDVYHAGALRQKMKTSFDKMKDVEMNVINTRRLFKTRLKSNLAVIGIPSLVSSAVGVTLGKKLLKKAQEINRGYQNGA